MRDFFAIWLFIAFALALIVLPFLVVPFLPGIPSQGIFLVLWFSGFMAAAIKFGE